jgi:hypothetical protein
VEILNPSNGWDCDVMWGAMYPKLMADGDARVGVQRVAVGLPAQHRRPGAAAAAASAGRVAAIGGQREPSTRLAAGLHSHSTGRGDLLWPGESADRLVRQGSCHIELASSVQG